MRSKSLEVKAIASTTTRCGCALAALQNLARPRRFSASEPSPNSDRQHAARPITAGEVRTPLQPACYDSWAAVDRHLVLWTRKASPVRQAWLPLQCRQIRSPTHSLSKVVSQRRHRRGLRLRSSGAWVVASGIYSIWVRSAHLMAGKWAHSRKTRTLSKITSGPPQIYAQIYRGFFVSTLMILFMVIFAWTPNLLYSGTSLPPHRKGLHMANNHPQTPTNTPEQDKIRVNPAAAKPLQQPGKTEPQVKPEKKP